MLREFLAFLLLSMIVLPRQVDGSAGDRFYPDPNVGTNATLAECDHGVWPPVELEGKSPLTVVWGIPSDASEREWVHDWVLARVRRPIITVPLEHALMRIEFRFEDLTAHLSRQRWPRRYARQR